MTKKRMLSILLVVCLLVSILPTAAMGADTTEQGYFQKQLLTDNAKTIYTAIDTMNLKTGTDTVTLSHVQTDNRDALFADFVAARDAYMLDHNLFYVDFDKMTLTQEGDIVTIGVGREDTYFKDGFGTGNVDDAIAAFNDKVNAIASDASAKATMQEKIRAAYDAVITGCSYALEDDAKPENVNYVRTAYGALVRGEAVCTGYAEALKAVLDEMGIENVTVWGTYDDEDDFNENDITQEPHMWNYVRMDDHRWYMLDATMEDGNNAEDFSWLPA